MKSPWGHSWSPLPPWIYSFLPFIPSVLHPPPFPCRAFPALPPSVLALGSSVYSLSSGWSGPYPRLKDSPLSEGRVLPRATCTSTLGPLASSLSARGPRPGVFSRSRLQAAQPSRRPSPQLPLSSLCLSRDQVLRVLAKNEKQLSVLRDLDGLKPQKVRTPQG